MTEDLATRWPGDDNGNMSFEDASGPNESSDPADKTFTSVEAVVARYRSQWRHGPPPDLAAFLPPSDQADRRAVLEKLIAADLAERLHTGETARLEDYLRRFPELGTADDLPCELIVAEYHARRHQGEAAGLEEYARRFPAQIARLKAELFSQAGAASAPDEPSASLDLEPGTVLGDFEIVCLLGTGSHARVYLARQRSLERHVVLKVSRQSGEEGKALAQLDNPHIVSVFSEQVIAGRRLLAMRYVPARTLADWMSRRAEIDTVRWRGADLLAWVDEQTAGLPGRRDRDGREEFAQLRFVPAMCRLVLGLVEALRHSHARGIVHRDIKPANILVDSAGRALLMDFNVAARETRKSELEETSLGGTLAYMAPEHLAALGADVRGKLTQLDHRSDIYSLGVVFFELLAGCHPWPRGDVSSTTPATIRQLTALRLQGAPSLPPRLAGVSPGARSIVQKCLAPLPDDRYQSAAELAEDLERLRDHRPLKVARDPSLRERLAKWARRHSKTVAIAATIAVFTAALAACGGWCDLRRFSRAEDRLAEAAEAADAGRSRQAAQGLLAAHGELARVNLVLPERFTTAWRSELDEQLAALTARVARSELHRFEQQATARRAAAFGPPASTGAQDLSADPLEVYQVLDRTDWEQLPYFRRLNPGDRAGVAEDVTEFLTIRAVALEEGKTKAASDASGDRRAAEILDLLGRVPAIHQDAAVIDLLRRHVRSHRPGRVETALLAAAASSEFDHYLVGVIAARRGEFARAIDCLETALRRGEPDQPPRFWARFLHAHCCEQAGRDDEAIADYGICIGLRPDFAWSYHNLGLIYTKRRNYALAVKNFQKALRAAPELAEAHANLGVAYFQLGRFSAAGESFDRAIDLGYRTAASYSNRAAARQALGDADGARDDLRRALKIDPNSEAAQENLKRLDEVR